MRGLTALNAGARADHWVQPDGPQVRNGFNPILQPFRSGTIRGVGSASRDSGKEDGKAGDHTQQSKSRATHGNL